MRPFSFAGVQRRPQRAGAFRAQVAQIVFTHTHQWRAQNGGQCQIVLRLQHETAKRDQIHHRNLGGQPQTVRPRHRNVQQLELADDLAAERFPPRQQDHDIAGTDGVFVAGQRHARIHPEADLACDFFGQPHHRPSFRRGVHRLLPGIGLLLIVRGHGRPELDEAPGFGTMGEMHNFMTVRRQPVTRFGRAKNVIDKAKDFRCRTAGGLQLFVGEVLPRAADMRPKIVPVHIELHRVCTLKTEDGLLLVADGENGAGERIRLPRAFTGEEILRQLFQDGPLFGAGILRFVDQDVVEPPIQPVEHPGRRVAPLQKALRLGDQIVIVQRRTLRLKRGIAGVRGIGDQDGGFAQRCGPCGPARFLRLVKALCHLVQMVCQIGPRFAQLLARQFRPRLVFLGQKDFPRGLECLCREIDRQNPVEGVGEIPVRFAAAFEPGGDGGDGFALALQAVAEIAHHRIGPFATVAAVKPAQGMEQRAVFRRASADRGFEPPPVHTEGGIQHLLQLLFTGLGNDGVDGARQQKIVLGMFQYEGLRQLHQMLRRLFVQNREAGGDRRLQWKTRQQILAEGVNGLDFQAARRFQRLRKQCAGPRQFFAAVGARPDLADFFTQRVIGHQSPGAKLVEQPRRHFRRRRLGIGQAQNAFGPRPGQQQPRHPVGKGIGFAGARIGGDPGRAVRIGRVLGRIGLLRGGAHASSSSETESCHSRTRARWS